VTNKNKLPVKWVDILCDPTNKQELFEFLSSKVADLNCPVNKEIAITSGPAAIIRGSGRFMEPCNRMQLTRVKVAAIKLTALNNAESTIFKD